ncbi:MAG: efflux RND transporter permease subunit [Bacteroides sp.]|nr:efflux RND transporter permease subunit [Ruminococcus flavefaciens]MCM1555333.1 efflux RND transporter permease subunit [Bacteroides sp.]
MFLNNIIGFSLRNRMFVITATLLLLLVGVFTVRNMDVDVFPDLNAPTVVIMTEASGMAPEEVELLVSRPVETSVNGAKDVRRVRSSSTTGFSLVWVEFNWNTDIYRARQIISEKIANIKDELPAGVGTPTMGPLSSILGEMMIVGITADSTSMQDLRTMADWTIRPRLLTVDGVTQVSILGGETKEYQILLNPDKMKHYDVSLNEVMEAVEGMNQNATGDILYNYGNEYIIRGMLSTTDIDKMGKAVVKTDNAHPILLSHIAKVQIGNQTPKTGVASVRAQPAVIMTINKQPQTNSVKLTKKIDEVLEELEFYLPADVRLSTDIYRQADFITNSINNVKKSLYEGCIFVVLVLFLFLMNVRTTAISLVTIPISLLVSLLTLRLFGLTINTMSLGGMAIAIGSLVDDAIVDVENVYKRLRENRYLPVSSRKPFMQVVFDASKEVRMPILNSTLIIIVCFVPLFFLSGMEGRLLAPLGIAFITALCASTLVALTLTPVLCSYLLNNQTSDEKADRPPLLTRLLKNGYTKALDWALRNRAFVLTGTGVLLLVTLFVFFSLGRNFLPPFNEGSFTINVSTMPGISLDESDRIGRKVEEILLEIPEIQTVGRKTGRAELDEHVLGVNNSELEVPFVLGKRSKKEVVAEIRQKVKSIPGINLEVGSPVSHRIDAMLSGTQANIAIKLFGTDLNHMFELGNEIKEVIEPIEGIADLNVEQQIDRPQLQIIPKREMLAKYGISLPEFAQIVDVLLAGKVVSNVYEGNTSFALTLKADEPFRQSAERIRNIPIDSKDGKIPLENVAYVVSGSGPNTINHENVSRKIVISANVSSGDLHSAVKAIREAIQENIVLPEGYSVEYGGQFESEQAASRVLFWTSMLSILVIFLLLFTQFKNVVQSAVILLNLPLALIGGVFAIKFTGGSLSIPAIIGFISLFGIATRNGILLIARYNDLRLEGFSLKQCIMIGSVDRLNPILMTALTSALALIPLAISGDLPGNAIQSPMAKVILGGLITSTLLNGFIVPILYLLINRKAYPGTGMRAPVEFTTPKTTA